MAYYNTNKKYVFIHIPKTAGKSIQSILKQDPGYHAMKRHDSLAMFYNKIPEKYFSFACVRNPWDRMVSMYYYFVKSLKSNEKNKHEFLQKGFKHFCMSDDYNKLYNTEWFNHITTNQIEWLEPSEHKCDCILKYENIATDWYNVASKLKIPLTLAQKNSTVHKHYKDVYDQELREYIGKIYEQDIDTFKYTF